MTVHTSTNHDIAEKLREIAELLDVQEQNPYRPEAYRRAADTIDALDADLRELLQERGMRGLLELPTIGQSIAGAIYEILHTGRWSHLERLRDDTDPEQLFQAVPGIGPELAQRIHRTLQIDTLEGLEAAAHDGRLMDVPGVGPRRAAAVRVAVYSLLNRTRARRGRPVKEPGIEVLLDVDREYRERAEAGQLPRIAPKRFNPRREAWLPVLNTRREVWSFTALYSNTARAHQQQRTRDWVVIYFHDRRRREGQHTVVTATSGALEGRRVVRGREAECRAYYESFDDGSARRPEPGLLPLFGQA
jgi:hypothetical protein